MLFRMIEAWTLNCKPDLVDLVRSWVIFSFLSSFCLVMAGKPRDWQTIQSGTDPFHNYHDWLTLWLNRIPGLYHLVRCYCLSRLYVVSGTQMQLFIINDREYNSIIQDTKQVTVPHLATHCLSSRCTSFYIIYLPFRECCPLLETFSSLSKCFLALRMLICVAADGIVQSDMITITYVLGVKTSINAANVEFRTSMLWKWACSLLQLNLNCLIMLLIFSNLCTSLWDLRWQ